MKRTFVFSLILIVAVLSFSARKIWHSPNNEPVRMNKMNNTEMNTETIYLGNGCFWCTEAVFEHLEGVVDVQSGYAGGTVANPTYEQVCTGRTGHAEVVKIDFNPEVITYTELLEAFFRSHDPTTLNRQGADVGTQYRSVIFYSNDEQKETALRVIKELNDSGAYPAPIVTEVTKEEKFYRAEEYHQDYFAKNPNQAYCAAVVAPKLEKFKKAFKEKIKAN